MRLVINFFVVTAWMWKRHFFADYNYFVADGVVSSLKVQPEDLRPIYILLRFNHQFGCMVKKDGRKCRFIIQLLITS